MDAIRDHFHHRLRNQLSNVLLFGSVIGITAIGLFAGCVGGVLLVGRTALHEGSPVLQLLVVVLSTVAGFAAGASASLFASPLVLRHAFFARPIGEWNGIRLFAAADADLPGGAPNVFVSGFSFGFGPFRPAIFVAEGAARILPRPALEAVLAHEYSHLACRHLGKRVFAGITTFVAASFFTSIALIGLHWSGYTEFGGFLSLLSGVIPAALTWMTVRRLLWDQEFEADAHAMDRLGVSPGRLLEALETLQRAIGGEPHPLVAERMSVARARISSEKTAEIAAESDTGSIAA
ncbi:MAG: M48 family metalloprotease [Bdellovibrionales bacterium]|nr:M48 family metalloprotease [Bdellovibrionales bacterium]